ncbi:Pre-mRNA splicing Prp18-interacting factor-domain-containing protein [Globomyces pollinis-pini]|nr:Pre-mRNA splicing Prp18-interacting factor-domain-containing protein [Globomyces pollinis-pini]
MDKWYQRGAKAAPAATKFRKGACENCGAITHKTKDCVERPRKKGAKWTGKNIQADEVVQNIELGFDAKRDRWNGYNPTEQLESIHEWEAVEEKRRLIREQKTKEKMEFLAKKKLEKLNDPNYKPGADDSTDEDSDDEKYADKVDQVGQKVDTKTRITVRNLRIREDTAKYLRNLDVDSAHYDPKTRSMRENPYAGKDPNQLLYAGDNFERYSGLVQDVSKLQQFAWEAEKMGQSSIHINSNPTQGELLYKQFKNKSKEVNTKHRDSVLARYGGEEHLESLPQELLLAQTEQYVEYNAKGDVIRGQEKAVVKSRYLENILVGNHMEVWGSWWCDGKWGYACCHATIKAAYCGGQAAIEAEQASRDKLKQQARKLMGPPRSLLEQHKEEKVKSANPGVVRKRAGDGEIKLDPDRLKNALREEEKIKKPEAIDRHRGKYGSNAVEDTMTDEQLEAYRLKRSRADDPMNNYIDDSDK